MDGPEKACFQQPSECQAAYSKGKCRLEKVGAEHRNPRENHCWLLSAGTTENPSYPSLPLEGWDSSTAQHMGHSCPQLRQLQKGC